MRSIRLRARGTAVSVVACCLAASFAAATPALAGSVTGDVVVAAATAAREQAVAETISSSAVVSCSVTYGADAPSATYLVVVGASAVRADGTFTSGGAVQTRSAYAGPKSAVVPISEVAGVTDELLPAIRKEAKLGSKVTHVAAPWTTPPDPYLNYPVGTSIDSARAFFADSAFSLQIPDWASDPSALGFRTDLPDGSAVFSLSLAKGDESWVHAYTVDPSGRLAEWTQIAATLGVPYYESSCAASQFGTAPVPEKIAASRIAPVGKVGSAAWRVAQRTAAVAAAKEIRAEVAATQEVTPSQVRIYAPVVLKAKGMLGVWKVRNVTGGISFALSDSRAGSVCWQVTARKGVLADRACL